MLSQPISTNQLIGCYTRSKQKGFEIENKNRKERLVYKLKKSLYGLKQIFLDLFE